MRLSVGPVRHGPVRLLSPRKSSDSTEHRESLGRQILDAVFLDLIEPATTEIKYENLLYIVYMSETYLIILTVLEIFHHITPNPQPTTFEFAVV